MKPSAVKDGIHGEPARILNFIGRCDPVCLGSDKRRFITSLIQREKAKVIIDAGSKCLYSTLLFSHTQKRAGIEDPDYYSFIPHPISQGVECLAEFAGLDNEVVVMGGHCEKACVYYFHENSGLEHIDMLFLHPGQLDLIHVCEPLHLIDSETVIIASITRDTS